MAQLKSHAQCGRRKIGIRNEAMDRVCNYLKSGRGLGWGQFAVRHFLPARIAGFEKKQFGRDPLCR